MKNNIFAMAAALAAMPLNPKMAAMIAMIKKAITQRNMFRFFKFQIILVKIIELI